MSPPSTLSPNPSTLGLLLSVIHLFISSPGNSRTETLISRFPSFRVAESSLYWLYCWTECSIPFQRRLLMRVDLPTPFSPSTINLREDPLCLLILCLWLQIFENPTKSQISFFIGVLCSWCWPAVLMFVVVWHSSGMIASELCRFLSLLKLLLLLRMMLLLFTEVPCLTSLTVLARLSWLAFSSFLLFQLSRLINGEDLFNWFLSLRAIKESRLENKNLY